MAKTKNGPDKKEAVCTPDNVLKEKNMDGLMVEPNNAIIDNDSLSYEIIPVDEEELIEQGYMKLPNKVFTRVSMALQNVPGQVAQQVTINAANKAAEELSKNAYKLVLKEGLHLANSKSLEGAYKGLALNTQNNLTTQADWLPISLDGSVVSRAPQIALGVFNAMSIATGQYFLSQINSKIAEIETGLKDIISYLEAEKRSEITANDMTLMGIFNNLGYIMSNDFERQITATELKEIKRESLSNLLFFQSKIDSIKEDLKITSKSKGDDLAEVFKNLYRDLPFIGVQYVVMLMLPFLKQ